MMMAKPTIFSHLKKIKPFILQRLMRTIPPILENLYGCIRVLKRRHLRSLKKMVNIIWSGRAVRDGTQILQGGLQLHQSWGHGHIRETPALAMVQNSPSADKAPLFFRY